MPSPRPGGSSTRSGSSPPQPRCSGGTASRSSSRRVGTAACFSATPPSATHVTFQVANFELPANDGLEPPSELPPGEEDPIKAMDAGDVLVMVVTDEPAGEPAPEAITLDDLRFLPTGTPRVPHGHSLAEGSFCRRDRCLRIEVDFGGRSPPPALRKDVSRVLSSLSGARS